MNKIKYFPHIETASSTDKNGVKYIHLITTLRFKKDGIYYNAVIRNNESNIQNPNNNQIYLKFINDIKMILENIDEIDVAKEVSGRSIYKASENNEVSEFDRLYNLYTLK